MTTNDELELQPGFSRRSMVRFGSAAALAGLLGFSVLRDAGAESAESSSDEDETGEDEIDETSSDTDGADDDGADDDGADDDGADDDGDTGGTAPANGLLSRRNRGRSGKTGSKSSGKSHGKGRKRG